ncbi:MAG: hypothetical protein Q7S16_05600 [bacterium]|nr:hypothetical protein [bacterium]
MTSTKTVLGDDRKLALQILGGFAYCLHVNKSWDGVGDVVPMLQNCLKRFNGEFVGYTDVVLQLYELLMLSHDELEAICPERLVWKALHASENHEFTKFIRIAGRRNSNVESRRVASSVLVSIAMGHGDDLLGGYGSRWRNGAKRFIKTV